MSRRISVYEDQVVLTNLMDQLEANLNANTRNVSLKNIDENKVWVESQKFLDVLVYVDGVVSKKNEIENVWRLPRNSVPRHYKVHIDARRIPTGNLNFEGEVEIDVLMKESSDYIVFHSKNQVIVEVKVYNKNTMVELEILDVSLFAARDTMTIYFAQNLAVNAEILVRIKYTSLILTGGSGFYRTSYSLNGQTRYLGTTQFQPAHARYCFPNYDEPEFKTTFDFKITHDLTQTAIANTFGNIFYK